MTVMQYVVNSTKYTSEGSLIFTYTRTMYFYIVNWNMSYGKRTQLPHFLCLIGLSDWELGRFWEFVFLPEVLVSTTASHKLRSSFPLPFHLHYIFFFLCTRKKKAKEENNSLGFLVRELLSFPVFSYFWISNFNGHSLSSHSHILSQSFEGIYYICNMQYRHSVSI